MEILKIVVKDGDLQLHQMQPASLRFLGHSLSDSWSPSPPLFSLQKTMIISIIIIFILILFPVTISRSIIIITTICLSPSLSSANNWTRPNMLQTPKTTVGGQADAEDQGILVFTRPLLQKESSLQEEILSVCPSSLFPSSNIQWFNALDHVNHIFSESSSCRQPVPPFSDPVTPSTNQYQQVVPSTGSVPPNTKRYLKEYQLADLFST